MTMVSSHTDRTQEPAPQAELATQRRCLVSGEAKDKSELVRFVLSPDGEVVPDIAARLPGRGLWVSATRAAIDEAASKNLFARAAKAKATVPADLSTLTETLLRRHCLSLIGLARAAGAAVMREAVVLEALSAGTLAGVVLASDAGGDIRKKTMRARLLTNLLNRAELGNAIGRDDCAVLGLRPHALTEKLIGEFARLRGLAVNDCLPNERNESCDPI